MLGALGVDASSPERVDLAIAHVEDMPWRRVLPPVLVVRQGRQAHVPVHVTHEDPVEVWIELDPEAGGGRREVAQADVPVEPRTVDGRLVGRATFTLPTDLPLGWHEIVAEGPSASAHSPLVVTPSQLELPEALRDGRAWGLMAQLYSVRSRASWGVGDLADLAEIGWLAGRELDADFLLINPLHAAEPVVPLTPSPYLPTTRRFVNPLYIRVEDVREAGYLSSADRTLVEWASEPVLATDDDAGPIDRDAAWTAKRAALEVVFAAPRSAARQAAFDAFVDQEGVGLETFALWCALAEKYGDATRLARRRRSTRRPQLVAELRVELAERVEFHLWLQWVADEQLAAAQRAALDGGMALGIMHDLAVGVHPQGADVWALGDVLARGATVGAPPDMYNQQGQNWSQPPWRPDALARAAYKPYRDMLRTVLRHAGAIRIDHVIGLFRLWWIPEGADSADGAYVRYDHEALVGILALEAHRAGAVVIGEDLGVVEPWVRDYLSERGILGTSVLWFERDMHGAPLAPEHYRPLVLATVTTHDLPPTAGYLRGRARGHPRATRPADGPGGGGPGGGAGREGPDARRPARARPGGRRPVGAGGRRGAAPVRHGDPVGAGRRLAGRRRGGAARAEPARDRPGVPELEGAAGGQLRPGRAGGGPVHQPAAAVAGGRPQQLSRPRMPGCLNSSAVSASWGPPAPGRRRSPVGWRRALDVPHLELDEVFWDAGWTKRDPTRRAALIGAFVSASDDGWVTDGNWSAGTDGLLADADAFVWLDYPRRTVMARVVRRTLRRGLLRTRAAGTATARTCATC